jgi:uncharacterized UPF0160 family protein
MMSPARAIISSMFLAFSDTEYGSHDFHEWLRVLEDTLEQLPVTNEDYESERRALEQAIAELHGIIRHFNKAERLNLPD